MTLPYLSAVLAAALCSCVMACASQAPFVWAASLPPEPPREQADSSPLAPGDTIAVAVRAHDSMTGTHMVGAEGHIVLPLVGALHVAGQSPQAIAQELERRLRVSIESPQVSVVLMSKRLEVSVLGEVGQPGKYQLGRTDSVAAAIALAGGLTEFADRDSIYLVRSGATRIRFRLRDLLAGGSQSPSIALRDGDLVVVE